LMDLFFLENNSEAGGSWYSGCKAPRPKPVPEIKKNRPAGFIDIRAIPFCQVKICFFVSEPPGNKGSHFRLHRVVSPPYPGAGTAGNRRSFGMHLIFKLNEAFLSCTVEDGKLSRAAFNLNLGPCASWGT
jgi:hypothetical protein